MAVQGALVDHMPTGQFFTYPDPGMFQSGEDLFAGMAPLRHTLLTRPSPGSDGMVTSIPYVGGIIRHFYHPFQTDAAWGPDTLALLWNFASGMGPRRTDERGILLPADYVAEGLLSTAQWPGATGARPMPIFPDLANSIVQDLVAGRVGPNTLRYALFLTYGPYSRNPTPNLVHPGQIDIPSDAIMPAWERSPPYEIRPGYTARWELPSATTTPRPTGPAGPAAATKSSAAPFVIGTAAMAAIVFWLVRRAS
jgi:hypothetical protein